VLEIHAHCSVLDVKRVEDIQSSCSLGKYLQNLIFNFFFFPDFLWPAKMINFLFRFYFHLTSKGKFWERCSFFIEWCVIEKRMLSLIFVNCDNF